MMRLLILALTSRQHVPNLLRDGNAVAIEVA